MKEAILKDTEEAVNGGSKNFKVGSNLERGAKNIGNSKIVDLDEEEDIDDLIVDIDESAVDPEKQQSNADKHK
jgi:hypothetical protein